MPRNLHHRLEEIINATESGGRLLSEPKLAVELGVSRAKLREAMRIFETQGRLRRQQGVGTFVLYPNQIIESGLEILESIETLAERIGLPVSMGDLEITNHVADSKIALKLDIPPGTSLLWVSRVIRAESRPVAYLVDIVPESIISKEDVRIEFTGSILDLLLNRGNPQLDSSRCEIQAIAANQFVAKALNIQRGDSLLYFDSVLYTQDGLAIVYSQSYFLPGYFKFHVVRRVGNYSQNNIL